MRPFVLFLVSLALLVIPATDSLASGYSIIPQKKTFPECHNPAVIKQIIKRFNWAEDNTWQRGIRLQAVERIRQRGRAGSGVSAIQHRHCRGHALLNNGRHPTIYFLIEEGMGFAGNGFNVEFCVSSLDRWNEDNQHCRTLR